MILAISEGEKITRWLKEEHSLQLPERVLSGIASTNEPKGNSVIFSVLKGDLRSSLCFYDLEFLRLQLDKHGEYWYLAS